MPIKHSKQAAKAYSEHALRPMPWIVGEVLFLFTAALLVWAIFIGGEARDAADGTHRLAHNARIASERTSKVQKIGVPAQHCLLALFQDIEPIFEKDPQSKATKDLEAFLAWTKKLPGGKCEPPKRKND